MNEMMLCPGFTSPEQFISGDVSQASDLYSVARLIIFCLLDNHIFWFLCSRPNTREVLQDHIDGLEQLPELMFCVKQNLSMSGDFRQSSVQQLKAKLPSLLGELKHAAPRLKELFNFRNDFKKKVHFANSFLSDKAFFLITKDQFSKCQILFGLEFSLAPPFRNAFQYF